jgi:hypothetical protein
MTGFAFISTLDTIYCATDTCISYTNKPATFGPKHHFLPNVNGMIGCVGSMDIFYDAKTKGIGSSISNDFSLIAAQCDIANELEKIKQKHATIPGYVSTPTTITFMGFNAAGNPIIYVYSDHNENQCFDETVMGANVSYANPPTDNRYGAVFRSNQLSTLTLSDCRKSLLVTLRKQRTLYPDTIGGHIEFIVLKPNAVPIIEYQLF